MLPSKHFTMLKSIPSVLATTSNNRPFLVRFSSGKDATIGTTGEGFSVGVGNGVLVGMGVAVLVGSGVAVGSFLRTEIPDELQELRRKNNRVIAMTWCFIISPFFHPMEIHLIRLKILYTSFINGYLKQRDLLEKLLEEK